VTLEIFQNSSYVVCDQECMFDHCCGSTDRNICQSIHSSDNALHNLHITYTTCTPQGVQQHSMILMDRPPVDSKTSLIPRWGKFIPKITDFGDSAGSKPSSMQFWRNSIRFARWRTTIQDFPYIHELFINWHIPDGNVWLLAWLHIAQPWAGHASIVFTHWSKNGFFAPRSDTLPQ